MNTGPDFGRLEKAMEDAALALPVKQCEHNDVSLQRACREVVLLVTHTRERVKHLRELFAARGGKRDN